jgi:hypothetical protein
MQLSSASYAFVQAPTSFLHETVIQRVGNPVNFAVHRDGEAGAGDAVRRDTRNAHECGRNACRRIGEATTGAGRAEDDYAVAAGWLPTVSYRSRAANVSRPSLASTMTS